MADAKLTALTAASALAGADLFYVSQSAASRKATGTQLLTLVGTTYVPLAGGTMTGALTLPAGSSATPALSFGGNAGLWYDSGAGFIGVRGYASTNTDIAIGNGTVRMRSSESFGWSLGLDPAVSGSDLILYRDAAATLAQRNGTNAQTLRVYRSYTDGSNYSRLAATWNTSTALLMAEGLGTEKDGNVAFNDEALATGATRGYIMVPSAAGVSTGVPADIPKIGRASCRERV